MRFLYFQCFLLSLCLYVNYTYNTHCLPPVVMYFLMTFCSFPLPLYHSSDRSDLEVKCNITLILLTIRKEEQPFLHPEFLKFHRKKLYNFAKEKGQNSSIVSSKRMGFYLKKITNSSVCIYQHCMAETSICQILVSDLCISRHQFYPLK